MRLLKIVAALLLLEVALFSLQLSKVEAQNSIEILSATPVNYSGNASSTVNRGLNMSVVIIVESQTNGTFLLATSIFDNCGVPAGFVQNTVTMKNGLNQIKLTLDITNYAFVGFGKLHISLSPMNYVPISSFDLTVYIDLKNNPDNNRMITQYYT
jgi:hypothetical protein